MGEDNVCYLSFVYMLALLVCMVGQTSAGLALFRVHARAAGYIGDWNVFAQVVGCWWRVLVAGSFGVGVGLWCSGLVAIRFYQVYQAWFLVSLLFAAAAGCQVLAGMAMLLLNTKV